MWQPCCRVPAMELNRRIRITGVLETLEGQETHFKYMKHHTITDYSPDSTGNVEEILQTVVKQRGASAGQTLAHLNNFVKLLHHVGVTEDRLGFTFQEIIVCLRLSLLDEATEVRAAGLRALRHLMTDTSVMEKLLLLQVDFLVARCIDLQQNHELEMTQALRLARKMISINAPLFPASVANSLIAVGDDGPQRRDGLARACTAIICELATRNPAVVARRGGHATVLKNVTACRLRRVNEALVTTILHVLNHPHTRQYIRPHVGLEQILAPYTDLHYRPAADSPGASPREDGGARFTASKMAVVACFRSWSGIINLCQTGSSGIRSLIGLFCIPNMEVQRALLEVVFEVFLLAQPTATADFSEAMMSIDPSRFQDNWRLSHGFVASEAESLLPHRSSSRPNLINNYLAFMLSAFFKSGLLESLVEVITGSADVISVQATILVGELLHMANTLLPHSHSHHLHCLPSLMNMAASFDGSSEKRLRASAAVSQLKRLHERKKRGVRPSSLYLDHILRTSEEFHCYREQLCRSYRDIFILKDTEDTLMSIMRDSHVLSHKENLDWNWNLIETVLKWPNVSLRGSKDENIHKFVQRLVSFYKPSSALYGSLKLEHPKAKQLTIVGCQFMEFLLTSEEDGHIYLEDLVRDIVLCLFSCTTLGAESSPLSGQLLTTLSQKYFLLLGTLSASPHGIKVLEKCSVFQRLLKLCCARSQEQLLKLTISTLDYSRDGLARILLSKILTAASDTCRLYATQHLRVLLRAGVEFFSSWGMELLVTQLHDRSRAVTVEALDILDEACEDKTNLHALTEIRPALIHLGDQGKLLLLRFASIPKGFSYLSERGFIQKQLTEWQKGYNLTYVDLIEGQLNEALTTYHQSIPGDKSVHRSSQRLQRPSVYVPVHLYGQLVQQKTGCHLLEMQDVVPNLSKVVQSPVLEHWEGIKQLKAALWALGHIGSSNWGVKLLQEDGLISQMVSLAHHCEVLSVRGTCLYVLGLISRTWQGCDMLKHHGWDAVRHSLNTLWPVIPEELEPPSKPFSSLPSGSGRLWSAASSGHTSDSTQTGLSPQDHGARDGCDTENCEEARDFRSQAEKSSRQLVGDRAQLAGGGSCIKKRSHSWNTHSRSRGVSSRSPNPPGTGTSTKPARTTHSRLSSPSVQKSWSGSLDSSALVHTSPRRTQSLKFPSGTTLEDWSSRGAQPRTPLRSSGPNSGRTSPRDAQGYATLRRLQQLRIQPSLSCSKALVSPATDVLFTDVITMKTSRLDSRLTSQRFLKALSFASLDQEELLSPINQSTLQRSSSVRSIVSKATFRYDYIGLALPVDISNMFQMKEIPYFQRVVAAAEEPPAGQTSEDSEGSSGLCQTSRLPALGPDQQGPDETELQEHQQSSCLYCSALPLLGLQRRSDGPGETGAPGGGALLRREVVRLVVNLSSSAGTKNQERNLLKIKENFPHVFDDICLYSDVSHLLAHCRFCLPARRFVQELFQDVFFIPMYEAAELVLHPDDNNP